MTLRHKRSKSRFITYRRNYIYLDHVFIKKFISPVNIIVANWHRDIIAQYTITSQLAEELLNSPACEYMSDF